MSSDRQSSAFEIIDRALQARLAERNEEGPFILGICGAQGSGKSTVAGELKRHLLSRGVSTAVLSLDDLYCSKPDREQLASSVHRLLATRGVPGTHDIPLGEQVLDALARPGVTLVPRFDKATDTRFPQSAWEPFEGPADLVIFEGWCIGARPQEESELVQPVNALEADEDEDGHWRRWANRQLAGSYQRLFARVDMLVLLAAPGFDVVASWRSQQEHALRESLRVRGLDTSQTLSDAQILRFIQHYQRLTEHILTSMPGYADVVVRLDAERRAFPADPGEIETG